MSELTIRIEDTGPRGQITLRGDLVAMTDAVRQVAGVAVPDTLKAAFAGETGAVWMSPDEVLVLVPHGDVDGAVARLSEALAGQHHLALDVSDARVILRLSGARVGEVLAKGVPCDVSDDAFPPGAARRTHLGGIAVGLWRHDAETWEVMAFRSFAHHLRAWLEQAAVPGSEVAL